MKAGAGKLLLRPRALNTNLPPPGEKGTQTLFFLSHLGLDYMPENWETFVAVV